MYSITNGGQFINNEFEDVYLVTTLDPIPLEAFTLQVGGKSSIVSYLTPTWYMNSTVLAPPSLFSLKDIRHKLVTFEVLILVRSWRREK